MSGTTAFVDGLTLTDEKGEERPVMVLLSRDGSGLTLIFGADLRKPGNSVEIEMSLDQLIELLRTNVTFAELAEGYNVNYKYLGSRKTRGDKL